MRFILSRKGFDSSWGGHPCPILPDETLLVLPIPVTPGRDEGDPLTYEDLRVPDHSGRSYAALMREHGMDSLSIGRTRRRLDAQIHCHLDPDLTCGVTQRHSPWRAAFGQCDAAEGHLRKQGISVGDVYLFFGLFRQSDGDRFIKRAKPWHVLFGYLQVGEVHRTDSPTYQRPEWAHPHFESAYVMRDRLRRKNGIYAASEKLVIDGRDLGVPGYGVFRYHRDLVLTRRDADVASHTEWRLPEFFRHMNISYHTGTRYRWHDGYFQSAFRGQEFVFVANSRAVDWFAEMLQYRRA